MADWGKRVLLGSLLGAVVGVLLGLGLARILWPPAEVSLSPTPQPTSTRQEPTPPPAATVRDKEEIDGTLVVISALYAVDGDVERARQRLSALGLEDPAQAVALLALRHAAAGNRQVATDLATLAAALGEQGSDLLAYVATATPTDTPTPTPTVTPSPTWTLTPTPSPTPTPLPTSTPIPTRRPAATPLPTATPLPPPPTSLPWDWWDHRVDLLEPPVRLVEARVAPGERYWRLVRLEWWKPGEGGNTMLYISTLNEKGQPVWRQPVIVEHGVQELLYTDPKPGEPYGANYPMASTLNSYQVFVGGDLPSDRVTGLGLGEWPGGMDHTTFVLIFQLSVK